ncbi:MAG: helix-turn-helix domain-containing protein [Bacteroidales bacterium]|nr:helix-turn-helix domain-containing protein [Bacteroidales bacterium]
METPTFEQLPAAVNQLNQKLETVLQLLKQQQTEPHNSGKLLTIDEAAQFLNLAKPTVYRLVHLRQIPFSKPKGSKKLYFNRPELEAWIKTGRKRTVQEIQQQAADFVVLPDQKKAKG